MPELAERGGRETDRNRAERRALRLGLRIAGRIGTRNSHTSVPLAIGPVAPTFAGGGTDPVGGLPTETSTRPSRSNIRQ